MSYPWDFETTTSVSIDAEDILDYVESNKEWFLDKLNIQKSDSSLKEDIKSLGNYVDSIVDKYNKVRIMRDSSNKNQEDLSVKIYEDLIAIRDSIKNI